MKIINTVREMQGYADSMRKGGKRIAFVPTMGYLHKGHLDLMREGKRISDCLVISVYVNPAQFAPGEDLEKYPRDFERDERYAREVGVDVMFCPSDSEIYPDGFQTYVSIEKVTRTLCGLSRPIFFRGVATICTKLFNTVKPHVTVFGKKDFQQLVVIKRLVADLNMDIEVVGMPTTREPDGLAMSSRNAYLKDGERQSAISLSRSLQLAKRLYDEGQRRASIIIEKVREYIEGHPYTKIDYINICNTETMEDVEYIDKKSVLALAVWIGSPRLIDNYVFGESLEIE